MHRGIEPWSPSQPQESEGHFIGDAIETYKPPLCFALYNAKGWNGVKGWHLVKLHLVEQTRRVVAHYLSVSCLVSCLSAPNLVAEYVLPVRLYQPEAPPATQIYILPQWPKPRFSQNAWYLST